MDKKLSDTLQTIVASAGEIILGKPTPIRLALTCILARGHLLIEDLPGVGKTTLAHVLAQLLGLRFNRIQFTSDMLPADVLGISVYEQDSGQFKFHPGPIFANVVLADEINRSTPKTQSALLEAMEERQITHEGTTHRLEEPFFVIATQNPAEQIGTYPLPESQLDRFLMSISLGYPDAKAERQLLSAPSRREQLAHLTAVCTADQLTQMQQQVNTIHVAETLLDYVQEIIRYSRESQQFIHGLSPRAGLALLHASKAWAMLHARDYVVPEDVQAVLASVVNHRLKNIEVDSRQSPSEKLFALTIP